MNEVPTPSGADSAGGAAAPPTQPQFPWRVLFWAVVLVSSAAGGIYLADRLYYAPLRAEQEKVRLLEERKAELERIAARLKYTERRAQILVLDQKTSSEGVSQVSFRFTEIDAAGNPTAPGKEFTLPGEEVFFDMLVIKFEDRFVEEGDALRGKALVLFRRVFSNKQKPEDGQPLDASGSAPEIYAASQAPSAYERALWARFWELTAQPEAARKLGVRVLQGEAVYQRLQKDRVYLIEQRATGELDFRPVRLMRAQSTP